MGLQKDLPTLILDFADKDNVKDDVWCYKAMVKEVCNTNYLERAKLHTGAMNVVLYK